MLKVDTGSFQAAASALANVSRAEARAIQQTGLERAGKVLHEHVVEAISLTDHSLRDLAELDHPYARRHGGIQIHKDRIHVVHTQSGAMKGALRTMTRPGEFRIWFDLSAAPHARHVIQGTKKMLARDVLWDTATERRTRRAMMLEIVKLMARDLRIKPVIRFAPVDTTIRSSTNT